MRKKRVIFVVVCLAMKNSGMCPKNEELNFAKNLLFRKTKVKIAYVGILAGLRLLKETVEVIAQMDNVEMHIGGFGEYEKWMKEAADKYDNIWAQKRLRSVMKREWNIIGN